MRVLISTFCLLSLGACGGSDECGGALPVAMYQDRDGDGFGDPVVSEQSCVQKSGWVADNTDCDDTLASTHPQAVEICDGEDNNCEGQVDEGLEWRSYWLDSDGDGYGDPFAKTAACSAPPDHVEQAGDCDDDEALIHPEAVEVCDDRDNDCNGLSDDDDPQLDLQDAPTWYVDADNDGYGAQLPTLQRCDAPLSAVSNAQDCNDDDPIINPDNIESCNGFDDDCNGLIDETDPNLVDPLNTYYRDSDQDGFGDPAMVVQACESPWFFVENGDDCDDSEPLLGLPGPWVVDQDGDGVGAGLFSQDSCVAPGPEYVLAAMGADCDDTDAARYPGNLEICNEIDDDCDLLIDDEDTEVDVTGEPRVWADKDGDGFGDVDALLQQCLPGDTGSLNKDDCEDVDENVNPLAEEICDGIDNDCNGFIDDEDPFIAVSCP